MVVFIITLKENTPCKTIQSRYCRKLANSWGYKITIYHEYILRNQQKLETLTTHGVKSMFVISMFSGIRDNLK